MGYIFIQVYQLTHIKAPNVMNFDVITKAVEILSRVIDFVPICINIKYLHNINVICILGSKKPSIL